MPEPAMDHARSVAATAVRFVKYLERRNASHQLEWRCRIGIATGSVVGSVVGGLILGVAESFTAYYFGAEWSPTIAFILLIVILIVKPEGLFGKKG